MKKLSRNEFLTDLFMPHGSDEILDSIAAAVFGASNRLSLQAFTESVMVDDSWIDTIESYLPNVEKIVRKPKSFIIDEQLIVPIEKAKRVTSESIRHLSSHTSNIRGIDDDGFVIPSKLLTTQFEEDLAIYENRFVNTLINRVFMFVNQQYLALKGIKPSETVKLEHNTGFEVAGYKFKYKMTTSVSKPFDGSKKNLKRVEDLMFRLNIIKGSQFYLALRKTKPVRPPIMRTNILKMDIDYNAAYKLWLYISACDRLAYTVNHADRRLPSDVVFEDVLRLANIYSARGLLYHLKDIGQILDTIPYRKKSKKKFKILEKNLFEPTVIRLRETTPSEDSSKFYLQQMQDLLLDNHLTQEYETETKPSNDDDDIQSVGQDSKKTSVYIDERVKQVPFHSLYKQITELNESLYFDALGISLEKPVALPGENASALKLRTAKICNQNAKSLKLLIGMKEKELAALKKLAGKQAEKSKKSLSVKNVKNEKCANGAKPEESVIINSDNEDSDISGDKKSEKYGDISND